MLEGLGYRKSFDRHFQSIEVGTHWPAVPSRAFLLHHATQHEVEPRGIAGNSVPWYIRATQLEQMHILLALTKLCSLAPRELELQHLRG